MCKKYGNKIMYEFWKPYGFSDPKLYSLANRDSLGFGNSQLLIGFHHNTPDNTLPIIWYDEKDFNWQPIFRRYNKNTW